MCEGIVCFFRVPDYPQILLQIRSSRKSSSSCAILNMAMVISGRAKAVIIGLLCFMLLGVVLVAASTKGWFVARRYHGERTAARIQVKKYKYLNQFVI